MASTEGRFGSTAEIVCPDESVSLAPESRPSGKSNQFSLSARNGRSKSTGASDGMNLPLFRDLLDQFVAGPPHLLLSFRHSERPFQRVPALVANMFRSIRENDRRIGEAVRQSA